MVLFLLALALTTVLLWQAHELALPAQLLLAAGVLATLLAVGRLGGVQR